MAFPTRDHHSFLTFLVFIAWLLYAGFNVANHEVWRDEVHSWAIAKSCESLSDVFEHTVYEGHPSLWYLLLFALKQFSVEIAALKWFHFALTAAAMWLLLWRGRFPLLQKALLVFGYFFIYEYVALARNYSIGLLCLFAFCIFFEKRKIPVGLVGCCVSIFLLAFTNLYGFIAAIVLGALLSWETFKYFTLESWHLPIVIVVWISATGLGALDIRPSKDCIHARGWKTSLGWNEAFFATSTLWNAYAPLPHKRQQFWNTNFFDGKDGHLRIGKNVFPYSWQDANKVKSAFGLVVVLLAAFYLRRKPPVLLFFLAVNAIYLLLQYTKFQGALRHHGHYWIMLIVSLWLARSNEKTINIKSALFFSCWYVLLVLQVVAGIIASWYERNHIFSPNEAAAKYLAEQPGFSNAPWICDNDYVAEGVAGILGKEILLHSGDQWRWGTYVVWDNKRNFCDQPCLVKIAEKLALESGKETWLLMHHPFPDSILINSQGLRHQLHFSYGIEASESYSIYHFVLPEKYEN